MESRNQQPVSGMSDGNTSVVLRIDPRTSPRNTLPDALKCRLRSGPLSPEQLADILDEPHTRRAWWLDLHTSEDLLTGTTISDVEQAVRLHDGRNYAHGSNGQPAAAPISFGHFAASNALTMPVCECAQPIASLRPFDWQCAKCKGVIPSLSYVMTDEQRHDLEAM